MEVYHDGQKENCNEKRWWSSLRSVVAECMGKKKMAKGGAINQHKRMAMGETVNKRWWSSNVF